MTTGSESRVGSVSPTTSTPQTTSQAPGSASTPVSTPPAPSAGQVAEERSEAAPAQAPEQEHTGLNGSPLTAVRYALQTGVPVQLQLANGVLTVSVPTSSVPAPETFTLPGAGTSPGSEQGRLESLLSAISARGAAPGAAQGVITQILQALRAGAPVTVIANHGTITVSIPASGATISLPAATPGTSSSISGLGSPVAATIGSALPAATTRPSAAGVPSATGLTSRPSRSAAVGLSSAAGVATGATLSSGTGLSTGAGATTGASLTSGAVRPAGAATSSAAFPQAGAVTGASTTHGSTLAFTGSQTETEAVLAAILAGVGGLLTFAARRVIRRPALPG